MSFSDPSLLAGGTAICFTSLMWLTERFAFRGNAAIAEVVDPNAAEACALYEIRLTEDKLLSAKIIKRGELSTCDNAECANCKPVREQKERDKKELLSARRGPGLSPADRRAVKNWDKIVNSKYNRHGAYCPCYRCNIYYKEKWAGIRR